MNETVVETQKEKALSRSHEVVVSTRKKKSGGRQRKIETEAISRKKQGQGQRGTVPGEQRNDLGGKQWLSTCMWGGE